VKATVIQFAAALTNPDAARLRAAYDLTLERYIPDLERRPPETVHRLRDEFLVRACLTTGLGLEGGAVRQRRRPHPGLPG
jgi:hypothetical protein